MNIIIGLGNPEKKYHNTRHNIGFRVVDFLKETNDFPDFEFLKRFNALISEKILDGKKIILAKPQTYMNMSGTTAGSLVSFYKVANQKLIVIHDDMDLALGEIRIVKNRGSAGHNGVESIIQKLGAKNFIRFRVGIIPKNGKPKNAQKFVLQNFDKTEIKIVEEVIRKTSEAILLLVEKGMEETMNKYNKRNGRN